tara:strand:+ start:184 stop:579 length:396 start_codon:yes stop_codon:yes gene_type:complete
MAHPKVKISDNLGNTVGVTDNRLDVNAQITVETEHIDIGDVEIKGHGAYLSGAINLSDSSAALTTASCKHVDIMANLSNTGIVYIGSDGVGATTGIALYPGDVYSVDVDNLNQIYAMSTISGDDINVQIFN